VSGGFAFHRVLLASFALACAGPARPIERAAESAPAPSEGPRCADIVAEGPHTRAVSGVDRACSVDADCTSIRLDCSNLRCIAVRRERAEVYADAIECSGYGGPVGNYDCMPEFHAESPVCVEGCCTSERRIGRATPEEACGAIGSVYAPQACTFFGPTFSIEACLADVAEIGASADEAGLRRLQIGLDCARSASTCAQIEFCVAQFHGSRDE
jgi:hypothetical protein